MYFACYCDDQFPIEPLLKELTEKGIAFEVKPHAGQAALWLQDAQWVEPVANAYENFKQVSQRQKQHTLSIENLKQLPITAFFIVASLLVAVLTQLGGQFADWFFIAQIQYYPRSWVPYMGIEAAWFSIAPVFLHFGIEHIVFNCLSFWYLGSILERKLSRFGFLGLILLVALISNYSQLFMSGPLFGGLSGVVYGLIGFALCYQRIVESLMIPKGLFVLALVWLVLGYTPFFAAVGLGNMANTAHLSGLLSGIVLFFIYSIFSRKQRL